MNWLKKGSSRSNSTANRDSPLKKRIRRSEMSYKFQCSTQVHDARPIRELCEEVQVDDGELVLENTSIKSMSSNDDDNDFPACWNKGQCEILKTVAAWPRVF